MDDVISRQASNEQKAEESLLKADDNSVSNDDVIYRQAAMDAFEMFGEYESNRTNKDWVRLIKVVLSDLPPAQPEVIRCKDCKHRYEDECPMHHVEWVEYDDDGYIDSDDVIYDYTEDDGYCFKAERSTG